MLLLTYCNLPSNYKESVKQWTSILFKTKKWMHLRVRQILNLFFFPEIILNHLLIAIDNINLLLSMGKALIYSRKIDGIFILKVSELMSMKQENNIIYYYS